MSQESVLKPFNTIGIIGAGTMGAGIAQICAQAGIDVVLYDLGDELLDKATNKLQAFMEKGREKGKVTDEDIQQVENHLTTTTDLNAAAQVELIIEAVPEKLDLKKQLFTQLDELSLDNSILASNTSSFSITQIASVTSRPEQVAGLHFFNPVQLMKLVEVIKGQRTHESVTKKLIDLALFLDKKPVLAKDTPGFIVNRVARPFYGEALKLLNENQGQENLVETIDTVLKEAGGFRMGPFELMDLIGIDVNLDVTQSVYDATFQEPRYRPSIIQQRMVEAGQLGRKSGGGFYSYE